jgi:hypothetical protein
MPERNTCTYDKCPGSAEGGVTDSKMRPWHEDCARLVLGKYQKDAKIEMAAQSSLELEAILVILIVLSLLLQR